MRQRQGWQASSVSQCQDSLFDIGCFGHSTTRSSLSPLVHLRLIEPGLLLQISAARFSLGFWWFQDFHSAFLTGAQVKSQKRSKLPFFLFFATRPTLHLRTSSSASFFFTLVGLLRVPSLIHPSLRLHPASPLRTSRHRGRVSCRCNKSPLASDPRCLLPFSTSPCSRCSHHLLLFASSSSALVDVNMPSPTTSFALSA